MLTLGYIHTQNQFSQCWIYKHLNLCICWFLFLVRHLGIGQSRTNRADRLLNKTIILFFKCPFQGVSGSTKNIYKHFLSHQQTVYTNMSQSTHSENTGQTKRGWEKIMKEQSQRQQVFRFYSGGGEREQRVQVCIRTSTRPSVSLRKLVSGAESPKKKKKENEEEKCLST